MRIGTVHVAKTMRMWQRAQKRGIGRRDGGRLGGEAFFDAAVGDEPDDGDDGVANRGERRMKEGERDGHDVNGDGDFAFRVAANGGGECGGFSVKSDERTRENEIGDGGEEEDDSVESHGAGAEIVVAHPGGGERHKRKPEEKMEIGPERRAIDAIDSVKEVMVVVPVDGEHDEAENVAGKNGDDGAESVESGAVRGFHLQNHDGDDDGENAVAEGFETVFGHGQLLER